MINDRSVVGPETERPAQMYRVLDESFDEITGGTHMNCRKGWRPSQIAQISQSRPIKAVAYDNLFFLKFDRSMHLNTNRLLPIDQDIYKKLLQPTSERSGLSNRKAEYAKCQEHPRIHNRA